jgi:aminomethyltransferase
MGYCLYGHELGPEISPLEAGLSWILRLEKDVDFIGKRALKNQRKEGGYRRLVGFVLGEKGIPRPGCGVYNEKGAGIGHVSSGTFSPSLQQGIGMAFVEPNYRKRGTGLQIEIRGKLRPSEVVRPPFVPSRVKKEEK